ncbi:MAG: beta-lactamase family protein [Clostridia bacterium]|nr:beta-lactamase family protein [Clostridia bacterium]
MDMNIAKLIDRLIENGINDGAFPSAVAAVGLKEELLACTWRGNTRIDGGTPVNEYTLYDMASLTKILAPTMIALRAIEEGLLTLDDTVGRFFDAPDDKKDITVRMLMTHTSGVTPAFDLSSESSGPDDAVRAILAHPLDGVPGDMPRYSCMGYILFAKMLEKLYGKKLDTLANDMVFAPLGMNHTGYLPNDTNVAATELNRRTGELIQGIVHDENARFMGGVSGNAGVFSDLEDMIKFTEMLAMGGKDYLSANTLRVAIRNRTPGFDVHRGLGFHLGGTTQNYLGDLLPPESFGHTGFTGTSIAVDPTTGFYVILMTNRVHPTRDNLKLMRFRRAFHNALYAAGAK